MLQKNIDAPAYSQSGSNTIKLFARAFLVVERFSSKDKAKVVVKENSLDSKVLAATIAYLRLLLQPHPTASRIQAHPLQPLIA